MGEFWFGIWLGTLFGFVAGVLASVIAAFLWDLKSRRRAYKAASKLVGTWEAYLISGRRIEATPMPGAGLTVVFLSHRWWKETRGSSTFALRISTLAESTAAPSF